MRLMKKYKTVEKIRKILTVERLLWVAALIITAIVSFAYGISYPVPVSRIFEESTAEVSATQNATAFDAVTSVLSINDTTSTGITTGITTAVTGSTATTSAAINEKYNLNVATAEQLMEVKGIGETYANRILAYRDEIGGFTAMEQLLDVAGIGEKRLAAIKEKFDL